MNIIKKGMITALTASIFTIFLMLSGVINTKIAVAVGELPPEIYIVERGDSLWSIAKENFPNHDPRKIIYYIRVENNLDNSSYLVEGQPLVMPMEVK